MQLSYLPVVLAVVCQTYADITPLTQANKDLIVKDHNDYRLEQPAMIMTILSWDDKLASLAQGWTEQCVFRKQNGQPYGQNIAAVSGLPDNTAAINSMFESWTDEARYNTDGTFDCCTLKTTDCCHLTQVLWADTAKVGCGLTFCPELQTSGAPEKNMAYMLCYYDPPGNDFKYNCQASSGCTLEHKPYIHY